MPSWNIHIAHVEELLAEEPASVLGIRDVNAFLFGNLVPDVYVGYMVTEPSKKIAYRDTHLADPDFIPPPNASLFYDRYLWGQQVTDLTLGAWTHLLCDHYYNLRTLEFIRRANIDPGDQIRARKQGDFDVFGRTLEISLVPEANASLLEQCRAFPHYEVLPADVQAAIEVTKRIVERNATEHVDEPTYSLLTREFFSATHAEVAAVLREALHLHAAGRDPRHLGKR